MLHSNPSVVVQRAIQICYLPWKTFDALLSVYKTMENLGLSHAFQSTLDCNKHLWRKSAYWYKIRFRQNQIMNWPKSTSIGTFWSFRQVDILFWNFTKCSSFGSNLKPILATSGIRNGLNLKYPQIALNICSVIFIRLHEFVRLMALIFVNSDLKVLERLFTWTTYINRIAPAGMFSWWQKLWSANQLSRKALWHYFYGLIQMLFGAH